MLPSFLSVLTEIRLIIAGCEKQHQMGGDGGSDSKPTGKLRSLSRPLEGKLKFSMP
jgi:hypothetical protein